ncbi:MAG: dihydrodipicolinate synthase family protein [Vicinamibacterales bacterium]
MIPGAPDRFSGLFAAIVTPVHDNGGVDLDMLDRVVDHALAPGVAGICVGGATGEYPHLDVDDRLRVIQRAAARVPAGRSLLAGIGGPTMGRSIELGEAAIAAGARALLVPMPMFFRYEQSDLEAFAAQVSRGLRAPCLIYNLPAFTNGLTSSTLLSLLRDEEFIVGLKDSSGDAGMLPVMSQARGHEPWSFFVGDDRLMVAGLNAGWDGAISGVAGLCPELIASLYGHTSAGRQTEAAHFKALLDELIVQLAKFPTPWGVRVGLAARDLQTGPLPLPLTTLRRQQVAAFTAWFTAWLPQTLDR